VVDRRRRERCLEIALIFHETKSSNAIYRHKSKKQTMDTGELIEILQEAGLSPYQAQAYVTLLELGAAAASELATTSGVPGLRIYDILRDLEEDGYIVTYTQDQLYARALPPSEALDGEHGIDFDVKNIHELSGQQCKRFGLTDSQQTALRLAAARGYYSVPRDVTAEDLAAELGITHQALSERLRRGHGSLVDHLLSNGGGTLELTELGQTECEGETS
jgi:predicted HTH transcriptional regulator